MTCLLILHYVEHDFFLTLSVTEVNYERTFSKLKLIKTIFFFID